MRLLFIKLKHIGDALLLTPTLTAARAAYPTAEIWVVVRRGCEGILAGCPAVDRVLTAAPAEASQRSPLAWLGDLRLALLCHRQRFDYAFELGDGDRGRWLAWWSGARVRGATRTRVNWVARRAITRFSDTDWLRGHRVEKDFALVNEVLPLAQPVPPLAFSRERMMEWSPATAAREFVVLHPGTRWLRKRWPLECWIALGRLLQARNLTMVISCGPDAEERETACQLQAALGPDGLNTDGQTTWAQLAGLLGRARLFVGVDTAAMHLAAACQCPTVALFGPSVVHFWRPWQVRHELLVPPGAAPEDRRMSELPVAEVFAACLRLLA